MHFDLFNDSQSVAWRNDVIHAVAGADAVAARLAWDSLHQYCPQDDGLGPLWVLVTAVATDSAGNPLPMAPNLVALKFREEQGSFLVGALAGLLLGALAPPLLLGDSGPVLRALGRAVLVGTEVVYVLPAVHLLDELD